MSHRVRIAAIEGTVDLRNAKGSQVSAIKRHNPTKTAQARVLQNARLINWTSIREKAIPFSWRPSGIAAHSVSNSKKNSIADRHSSRVSPTVITRRRISWAMLVQGHDPHGLVSDIQDQLTSTPNPWNFLLSAV